MVAVTRRYTHWRKQLKRVYKPAVVELSGKSQNQLMFNNNRFVGHSTDVSDEKWNALSISFTAHEQTTPISISVTDEYVCSSYFNVFHLLAYSLETNLNYIWTRRGDTVTRLTWNKSNLAYGIQSKQPLYYDYSLPKKTHESTHNIRNGVVSETSSGLLPKPGFGWLY